MTKRFFSRFRFFSCLLTCASLLLSCQFLSDTDNSRASSSSGKTAHLSLSIGEISTSARNTINPPSVTVSDLSDITLSAVFGTGSSSITLATATDWASLGTEIEIGAGTWASFTLTAYIGGAKYSDTKSEGYDIGAGTTTALSFSLAPADDETQYGGILFSLDVTDTTVKAAKAVLTSLEYAETIEASLSPNGTTFTFARDKDDASTRIAAGAYRLSLILYADDAKALELNTYKAAVNVAPGLTSTGSDTMSNVSSVYSISYYDYDEDGNQIAAQFDDATIVPESYTRKSAALSLPTPKASNTSTFIAWYATSDFSGEAQTEIASGNSGDRVFYAKRLYARIFVSASGDDTHAGISSATAVQTLSQAVTMLKAYSATYAMSNNDWTIYFVDSISGGTTITITEEHARSLTLEGLQNSEASSDKDILSGTSSTAAVTLANSIPVTIYKLCIRDGAGGIISTGSGALTIKNAAIMANTGSGISIEGNADVDITAALIGGTDSTNGNTATNGAGIYKDGNGTLTISNSTIAYNTATNNGGGVYVANGTFILGDNVSIPLATDGSNDVYLATGTYITISDRLTNTVATITPQSYTNGVQILSGTSEVISASYRKFAVSDNGNDTWFIHSDGTLASLGGFTTGTITVDGTAYNNVVVDSADTFEEIVAVLNNDTSIDTSEICISLTSDITVSSDYTPYGYDTSSGSETSNQFEGVFDGGGHTITVGEVNASMFTPICYNNAGIIQNVKISLASGVTITAKEGNSSGEYKDFAGICFENSGTIRNCQVDLGTVTVELWTKTGGISGGNEGIIENCVNMTNLVCTYNQSNWAGKWAFAGGICGHNNGTIKNCVNYGTITLPTKYSSGDNINGIPGAITGAQRASSATTQNCYWRKNCIYTDTAQTTTSNNMVYNSSVSGIREGTFTGNGYFADYTDGTLTAGDATTSVTAQTLEYGSNLLSALNAYASTDSNLSTWVLSSDYAAVLNIGD